MLMKNILVIYVALILLFTSISGCIFEEKKNEDRYITTKEFFENREFWRVHLPEGKTVYIKDKVLEVKTFKLIKIVSLGKGNFSVFPDIAILYTQVIFESHDAPLLFLGNVSHNFTVGKVVEFSLIAQKFDTFTMFEPVYAYDYLHNYYMTAILGGFFSLINFTKQFSEDNTKLTITITNTTDFYPLPKNWREIYVEIRKEQKNLTLPTISVYNQQGNLIGNIGDSLTIINNEQLKKGDYLTFEYFPNYNSTMLMFYAEDIVFWVVDL